MCDICNSQGKSFDSTNDPADNNWETYECYQAISAWNMRVSQEDKSDIE